MSTRLLPPLWNSQAIEDRPREVGLGHSTVDQVPDRHEVANGPVRQGWHEDMHEITNAPDVVEVVQWAEEEARKRQALYTIFARMSFDKDSPGLVWLATRPDSSSEVELRDARPECHRWQVGRSLTARLRSSLPPSSRLAA